MLVQYLIGLCCLKAHPDAVDVTLGDMVLDPAAGKERDVDVTVTISGTDGLLEVFKAYEVKREGPPLDVAVVEQLCIKLLDMPSVTHRAIVSASGFTAAAQTKAAHHGVDLFEILPWTRPLQDQFPAFPMSGTAEDCFPAKMHFLCWIQPTLSIVARAASRAFTVSAEDPLFRADGGPHRRYRAFSQFRDELLLRSTEVLFPLEPAVTVLRTFPVPFSVPDGTAAAGPAWPHTHTLDVTADEVFVDTGSGLCRIDNITINGQLQWQRGTETPQYFVVSRVGTGEAFAGALIATEKREGHLTALVFSPKTREIGIHFVRLAEKHLNCLRQLTLEPPGNPPEA